MGEHRPTYTAKITYRHVEETSGVHSTFRRYSRSIPWNWRPSRSDIIASIRRLRDQFKGEIEVQSVQLIQHTVINTLDKQQCNAENPFA